MTANFILTYGDEEALHAAGCSHTKRRDFQRRTNHIEPIEAATWQEAHASAAFDWLDSVDYEDGLYDPENVDSLSAGITAYRNAIKVFPCAKQVVEVIK